MEMFTVAEALARPRLDPDRAAVVVIDMVRHQLTPGRWMLGDYAAKGHDVFYLVDRVRETVVPAHRRLLAAARARDVKVVYLRIGTRRRDHADGNRHLMELYPVWEAYDGSPACEVIDELAPEPGDVDLLKLGSGGFTTAPLDATLRELGVEHVLYTGVVTSACVLLTLTAGFDLGYYGYLVADATATFTAELQRQTEELVGAAWAEVVRADDIVKLLTR